jgi:hypothetical protein
MEEAKEKIKNLVSEFSSFSKEQIDGKSENQIKSEFIDPLFEALGWDMRKDAEREERVLKGRADYIMKIRNQKVLVIEAKRGSVKLSEEEGRQAVSYAYHNRIKFAVLTNFKEVRIYHALSNIKNIDRNLLQDAKGYLRIDYVNFESQFDRLWLISKESFEKGDINKLLNAKDERLAKPINESLLDDLLRIREWLSKELKTKKTYLQPDQIDESVQMLIDRLIFIRSVEDRGLERKDYLLNLADDVKSQRVKLQLFPYLLEKFKDFNKKYDSKLFEEGFLEKECSFGDEVLFKVIKGLYYGTENDNRERYLFDQIPGDLLGSIYEQYLGNILKGSEKRVKVEEGSGKRKSMGIFYTPSYIVDYIIINTVREYLKDRSIDEILQVKILDPACGSGSFIVRAFQEVCVIIEEKLKNKDFSKEWSTFKSYEKRLNLGQKISILINCIHGVDLDEKAIELARLNLLLKLLEEEGEETKKLLLPHLENNIKCGNSLIEDQSTDKSFIWKAQFPEIFKHNGFDIIVGNPPYGAELPEKDAAYLENRFKLGNTDTACLFMSLSTMILKNHGIVGFIVPKPFVYSSTWKKIREKLLNGITELADCGKVWKEVKLEQVIYFFKADSKTSEYYSCVRKEQEIIKLGKINKETFNEFGFLLNGISEKELKIGRKVKNAGFFLNEFVTNQRGAMYQQNVNENKSDFKVLGGAQIGRYFIKNEVKGYLSKKEIKDEKAFIKKDSILVQNIVAHIENPIDHIRIISSLPSHDFENFVILDTVNQLENKGKLSSSVLIAILNSNLIGWYAYRFIFGKAIRTMHFDNAVTDRIPIPKIDINDKKDKQITDKLNGFVNKIIELQNKYNTQVTGKEKELLEQQIKNVEYEINDLIYELYGLNSDEKQIIESSLK